MTANNILRSGTFSQPLTTLNPGLTAITVPVGIYWEVLAIEGVIVTTATVGNRLPQIVFSTPLVGGGSSIYRRISAQTAVPASKTVIIDTDDSAAATNLAGVAPTSFQTVPFKPFLLQPGDIVGFFDANTIDAADETAIAIHYNQYTFGHPLAGASLPVHVV